MAIRAQVTGTIAEPVPRFTPKQQAVLELRINATPRERNKSTGQWEDVGSQIWIGATFWERDAQVLGEALNKGDRVTVEGTLVQETYQRRDGATATSLSLRWPRFLGTIPSRRSAGPDQSAPEPMPVTGSVPAVDPWADGPTQAAPF